MATPLTALHSHMAPRALRWATLGSTFPPRSTTASAPKSPAYVDDIAAVWQELKRMAGANKSRFVVTVSPYTLTARLFPGAKWALWDGKNQGVRFVAQRISDDVRDGLKLFGSF